MRVEVVDTETSHMDPDEGALVEIAAVSFPSMGYRQTLVNPGRPISYGAMAVHMITNEMVADAPDTLDALGAMHLAPDPVQCEYCDGTGSADDGHNELNCAYCEGSGLHSDRSSLPDVLVFHNAEFDKGFLPQWLRDVPTICTYRCSMHLFPDAESHSNMALAYELGLDFSDAPVLPEDPAASMPHRALFDAWVTTRLLERLCEELDREDPIEWLLDLSRMPFLVKRLRFGKHRGELCSEIPASYWFWAERQDFDADIMYTADHWLREKGRRG